MKSCFLLSWASTAWSGYTDGRHEGGKITESVPLYSLPGDAENRDQESNRAGLSWDSHTRDCQCTGLIDHILSQVPGQRVCTKTQSDFDKFKCCVYIP